MAPGQSDKPSETSHGRGKRAKFKANPGELAASIKMSPPSLNYHCGARCTRTKAKTFWTIVIAFMTTQLIPLCDHPTSTSAASSSGGQSLGSGNQRQPSVFSIALAGGAQPATQTHSQHKQRHQHRQHALSTTNLIQNSWPPTSGSPTIQQQQQQHPYKFNHDFQHQNYHHHHAPLVAQSASLLPPPDGAGQQHPLFQQIAPLSMYHQQHQAPMHSLAEHQARVSTVGAPSSATSSPMIQQQQQQQTLIGNSNTPRQANSAPSQNYDENSSLMASDSFAGEPQENTDASSGASQNTDQLVVSGTQELGQEAPPASSADNQDPSQSARERCRELISLTLLSFKDLTPSERASEEIDCANLREQIAAAAAGRSSQASGSSRRQQAMRQQTQQDPAESFAPQPGDSESSGGGGPTQLPADEFPLAPPQFAQTAAAASLNNQRRPLIAATPPQSNNNNNNQPRQNSRGQPGSQAGQQQSTRKQQVQLTQGSFTPAPSFLSLSSASSGAQLNQMSPPLSPSASATDEQQPQPHPQPQPQPQQQFFASKWEPKNSYINQVQALLLQQQQQQQSHRAQEHQNMLQFYQQLAAVQKQHSQPQITPPDSLISAHLQPAATATATTTTTTTTTTAAATQPPTTLATTFESLLETTTMPPTTTSTTTTTTTARPNQPKIRIGAPPGGRRAKNGRQMRTSTTTTTTTTTHKPSTMADYADGSDVSTDYYDEYDDQQQQTTTTTTTQRPRGGRARKPKRRFTTPKPTTTTTTTLSPGYQPRPDGRIIDYMADPNFPRELKGADLTNYPFYISVPEKIDFDCKGRHDGYYSNIDLHCQIYHHCAIGNRYDFLCPNYTLFDQTTFTCRFINTVDCDASTKHYDRNNALYVEKDKEQPASSSTTSTTSTTTTSTTTTTTTPKPQNTQLSRRLGQLELPVADQRRATSSAVAPSDRISALALVVQQQRQLRTNAAGGAGPGLQSKADTTIK